VFLLEQVRSGVKVKQERPDSYDQHTASTTAFQQPQCSKSKPSTKTSQKGNLHLMFCFFLQFTTPVGDRMILGCKMLILPKSGQICPNLASILPKNFARRCSIPTPTALHFIILHLLLEIFRRNKLYRSGCGRIFNHNITVLQMQLLF